MRGETRLWLVLVAASACSGEGRVFLETPWPADHTAIVHVVDDDGAPLAAPAIYEPGVAIHPALNRFERFRIYARTYAADRTAPNEQPFATCTAALGPEGTPLPAPSSAWSTPLLEPNDNASAAFEPEALDALAELDVRLIGCAPIDHTCDGYRVERVELPRGFRPARIAAVNDDVAMVAGRVDTATAVGRFVRVDGDVVTLLPEQAALRRRLDDLEWDHQGTYFGVNKDGGVIAADADAVPRSLPMPLVYDGIGAGLDGTVLAFDEERTIELRDQGRDVVERADVPFGLEGVEILRADRIAARTQKTIYSFDGTQWAEELEVAVLEEVRTVLITDEMLAFVGQQEVARIRDEGTGLWGLIERPFDEGRNFDDGAAFSGRRFAAIGEHGMIVAWTGAGWCDLSLGDNRSVHDIDAAEPSNVVWAIARGGGRNLALRVVASPP